MGLTALCYNWAFFTVLGYAPFPMNLEPHQARAGLHRLGRAGRPVRRVRRADAARAARHRPDHVPQPGRVRRGRAGHRDLDHGQCGAHPGRDRVRHLHRDQQHGHHAGGDDRLPGRAARSPRRPTASSASSAAAWRRTWPAGWSSRSTSTCRSTSPPARSCWASSSCPPPTVCSMTPSGCRPSRWWPLWPLQRCGHGRDQQVSTGAASTGAASTGARAAASGPASAMIPVQGTAAQPGYRPGQGVILAAR